MGKKVVSLESMVYRSTKLYSQINTALQKEVDRGLHKSFNSAVNHHLQQSLGIEIPTYLTLGNLSVKDLFRFANNSAYKIYKVMGLCKRSYKKKGIVRMCQNLETKKIIYLRCDRETIKIEQQ